MPIQIPKDGNYHRPLTADEIKRGVTVIKYIPYNKTTSQLTLTPVCKIGQR